MRNSSLKKVLVGVGVFLFAYGLYYFADNVILMSGQQAIDPLQSPSQAVSKNAGKVSDSVREFEDSAPNFSLKNLDGHTVELTHFKDKVVIVNFWASWCPPCVRELPSLLSLIEKFKGDVVLIAVSADEDENDLREFLKANKISENLAAVHIVRDPTNQVASLYGTNKLPESYILRRQNRFHRKIEGLKNWSSPAFIKTFNELTRN